jgi:hypothetical protein
MAVADDSLMQLPRNLDDWSNFWRELYEERAGIKEYMGNLPRPMAEREAEVEIRKLAWRENT